MTGRCPHDLSEPCYEVAAEGCQTMNPCGVFREKRLSAAAATVCGLCYHEKSTADTCNRTDCDQVGGAS